jgi:hypothetical protein
MALAGNSNPFSIAGVPGQENNCAGAERLTSLTWEKLCPNKAEGQTAIIPQSKLDAINRQIIAPAGRSQIILKA